MTGAAGAGTSVTVPTASYTRLKLPVAASPWLMLSWGLSGVTKMEYRVSDPPAGRRATMLPIPFPAGPGGELAPACHCGSGTSVGLMIGPFWT